MKQKTEKSHSTVLFYQPSTVLSIAKNRTLAGSDGCLSGRTDACRVGRTLAGAINNRAPGMAARCPVKGALWESITAHIL